MKTVAIGLSMIAGAAITLSVVNSLYPDLPRRMMRDGRRVVRNTKRTFCQFGDMIGR